MHSLSQLPANPVVQSRILILITAQVGLHTSTSHGVFPPILCICPSSLLSHVFISFPPLCLSSTPLLYPVNYNGYKHEYFVNRLCPSQPSFVPFNTFAYTFLFWIFIVCKPTTFSTYLCSLPTETNFSNDSLSILTTPATVMPVFVLCCIRVHDVGA